MPTPRANETKSEYISRCIPAVIGEGTAEDEKQAAAVCYSMWEEHMSKLSKAMVCPDHGNVEPKDGKCPECGAELRESSAIEKLTAADIAFADRLAKELTDTSDPGLFTRCMEDPDMQERYPDEERRKRVCAVVHERITGITPAEHVLRPQMAKATGSNGFDLFIPITKVNTGAREVWGWASIEEPDGAGEIMDYATSKPYFLKWSDEVYKASGGKSRGNVRAMHQNIAAGKLVSLQADDARKGFFVGAKIIDDNEWRKVEEGVYTGFSVGGKYVKRWPDMQRPGLIRYTAGPNELSTVDRPCVKGATFELVKADGVTEQRAFAEEHSGAALVLAKIETPALAGIDYGQWVKLADFAPSIAYANSQWYITKASPNLPPVLPMTVAGQPIDRVADAFMVSEVDPDAPPAGDELANKASPAQSLIDEAKQITAGIPSTPAPSPAEGVVKAEPSELAQPAPATQVGRAPQGGRMIKVITRQPQTGKSNPRLVKVIRR